MHVGHLEIRFKVPGTFVKEEGIMVKFHCFPSEKKQKERRKAWINACCRADGFICKKDCYICSLHFIGKNGPTQENPDPIPATASEEKASYYKMLIYGRIIFNTSASIFLIKFYICYNLVKTDRRDNALFIKF